MDNKIKHLEMIQVLIQRMANNSFQLKGWTVALIGIIGALSADNDDKRLFLMTFIPLIAFWGLDSFYLQLERKFTVLYSNVAAKRDDEIDFNMDLRKIVIGEVDQKRTKYIDCVKSKSELGFYLPLTGMLLIVTWILMELG